MTMGRIHCRPPRSKFLGPLFLKVYFVLGEWSWRRQHLSSAAEARFTCRSPWQRSPWQRDAAAIRGAKHRPLHLVCERHQPEADVHQLREHCECTSHPEARHDHAALQPSSGRRMVGSPMERGKPLLLPSPFQNYYISTLSDVVSSVWNPEHVIQMLQNVVDILYFWC